MISFWADARGLFSIEEFVAQRGAPIASCIAARAFDDLESRTALRAGTQVLAALDQLTPSQSALVGMLAEQARAAGLRVLNQPSRVLLRAPLLAELSRRRLNDFGAWPAAEWRGVNRFPVFVRGASDHGGNLTRLLQGPRELGRAIADLRVRGWRPDRLLVVEFCDARDSQGRYRKYAAMKVGGDIVPLHLMVSDHWMVKSETNAPTVEAALEELAFIEESPHDGWLREVFSIAGVDYGRIDYGVRDGRPQAWEINLNPTLGRRLGSPPRPVAQGVAPIRERARSISTARLLDAFRAVDVPDRATPDPLISLDPGLLARAASELKAARRREARLAWLRDVTRWKWIGAPLRCFLRRASPR